MKTILEIFDTFLLAFNNDDQRKLALLELWDSVNENADNFSCPEIPGIIISQAEGLDRDYKRSWFNKSKVIDKHRNLFKQRIEEVFTA